MARKDTHLMWSQSATVGRVTEAELSSEFLFEKAKYNDDDNDRHVLYNSNLAK